MTSKIELEINAVGLGTLIINGEDVSDKISKICFTSVVGEATTVDVTFINVETKGTIIANTDKINKMKEIINKT